MNQGLIVERAGLQSNNLRLIRILVENPVAALGAEMGAIARTIGSDPLELLQRRRGNPECIARYSHSGACYACGKLNALCAIADVGSQRPG